MTQITYIQPWDNETATVTGILDGVSPAGDESRWDVVLVRTSRGVVALIPVIGITSWSTV